MGSRQYRISSINHSSVLERGYFSNTIKVSTLSNISKSLLGTICLKSLINCSS